jgi:hypothetical protein
VTRAASGVFLRLSMFNCCFRSQLPPLPPLNPVSLLHSCCCLHSSMHVLVPCSSSPRALHLPKLEKEEI